MFHTFTGSSRRPRQVNLSGRNTNPFASLPQSSVPQGSPHNAVAQAQQERKARQRERERLQAAKTVQRTWRGHAKRKEIKRSFRARWDDQEASWSFDGRRPGSPYGIHDHALAQLRLLVQFASPRDDEDVQRVRLFTGKLCPLLGSTPTQPSDALWNSALLRLVKIGLATVRRYRTGPPLHPDVVKDLVSFLAASSRWIPQQLAQISLPYYHALGGLVDSAAEFPLAPRHHNALFRDAVLCLLDQAAAYDGLVAELLTTANLHRHLDLDAVAAALDFPFLTSALKNLLSPDSRPMIKELSHEQLLWLLAHFIYIRRTGVSKKEAGKAPDAHYVAIVSSLLSELADDLRPSGDLSDSPAVAPMAPFVQSEITTLVNQDSISSLLIHSQLRSVSGEESAEEPAALASYALTLLRIFPRRADEIRMWLFLGSSSTPGDSDHPSPRAVPAMKYFWDSVKRTSIFQEISEHPRNAIDFLKPAKAAAASSNVDQEWRILLLFLELYTFVLKVMDDEEFIKGADDTASQRSWTRQSALKLSQVRDLTTFLKNLAFSMYWYSSQILESEQPAVPQSLASYFGNPSTEAALGSDLDSATKPEEMAIGSIAGLNLNYLKGTVTGLLRMIYERDSRRGFLPKDHWLMTEHFDMEGFISAVVTEEDFRHQNTEAEEDDDDLMEAPDDYDDLQDVLVGSRRTQRLRHLERLRRQQRRAAKKKHLEAVTPRLEILQNMPFFIPFPTRVEIFREFVMHDQMRRREGFIDPDHWRMAILERSARAEPRATAFQEILGHQHAKVRRDHVFDDAFEQFYELGDRLKEPIQITFVDRFDTPEAGIDGGGVTKEFLTSVTNEAFMPSSGRALFVENDQHLLYPNPAAVDEHKDLLNRAGHKENSRRWNDSIRNLLQQYEFLGRLIGKCMYEGILVDIHFVPFFLVKWALTGGSGSAANESSYRANINDLRDLDEGLYQGLLQLKNFSGNVEEAFGLDFTVTDTISTPVHDADGGNGRPGLRAITRDLRPHGSDIAVTNENRLVYISYMARHRLQLQPHLQTNAFLRGLGCMIQPSWLSMFNQSELQTLIGGDSSDIDVADLRQNTTYGGVYAIGDDGLEHPAIQKFWQVMHSFSDEDRRKVLKYVTSTPRAPLLGFSQLNPRFSIRDSGSDQARLPSTSTCVNLLKLPIYDSQETLREKLLYAINAGAGFNLS